MGHLRFLVSSQNLVAYKLPFQYMFRASVFCFRDESRNPITAPALFCSLSALHRPVGAIPEPAIGIEL
jgi:hypothetical protein